MNNKGKVLIVLLALIIFLTVFHFYRQKEIDAERESGINTINNYNIITNYSDFVLFSWFYLGQLNDLLETKDQKQIRAYINAANIYLNQTNSLNLSSMTGSEYKKYYDSKISHLIKDTNEKLLNYERELFNSLNSKPLNDSEIKSLIKNNNALTQFLHDSYSPSS